MPQHPSNQRSETASLRALAKTAGLMTSYKSAGSGKPVHAPAHSLIAALNSLGIAIDSPAQAEKTLATILADRAKTPLEPVYTSTADRPATVTYRLKTTRAGQPKANGRVSVSIQLESGETQTLPVSLADCAVVSAKLPDGSTAHAAKLKLPKLPMGYHTLRTKAGPREDEALIISAPTVSYQTPEDDHGNPLKSLGLFCPTYAIRSHNNLGVGNLTDLRQLAEWAHDHGCDLSSTLPLLAVFNDDSQLFEPAPYSPVSRNFWNELFLDAQRTSTFENSKTARKIASSAAFTKQRDALRNREDTVDYRAAAKLQNQLLDALANDFFNNGGNTSPAFKAFLEAQPDAKTYARFRATCEKRGEAWRTWPDRMRNGSLKPADADPQAEKRHLYAQFAMTTQMAEFSEDMASRGGRLYLDLAIGVHPDGFDVWNNQQAFMLGSVVGAPPDPMFTEGQNWGFPPLHPEVIREQRYKPIIDAIRTHTDHAHFLRLDHVMGFHRLFLIPESLPASEGVYARYHDDELFAMLSLESHRAGCRLIGENLGTVPQRVEQLMTKHKVGKLYVGQFEMTGKASRGMRPVPRDVAASLNTHDLPTFANNFNATDMPERIEAGVFNPDLAEDEIKNRLKGSNAVAKWLAKRGEIKSENAKPTEIAIALYRYLAASDAELALVNIEDLWGETRWQNIPGTTTEHDNWQHKLAKTLDEITADKKLAKHLESFAKARQS